MERKEGKGKNKRRRCPLSLFSLLSSPRRRDFVFPPDLQVWQQAPFFFHFLPPPYDVIGASFFSSQEGRSYTLRGFFFFFRFVSPCGLFPFFFLPFSCSRDAGRVELAFLLLMCFLFSSFLFFSLNTFVPSPPPRGSRGGGRIKANSPAPVRSPSPPLST